MLSADIRQSLLSASWSPIFANWLTDLSLQFDDAADFATHFKLLQACNTCLDNVKIIGCDRVLQSLGVSCFEAMAGKAFLKSHASHLPISAQLTADLVTDLAATTCQMPSVLKALQSGVDRAAVSFPKAQKLVEFLTHMKMEKDSWDGIVFVKTKAGVFALTELLQNTAGLEEMSFTPLTGHDKVAGVTNAMQGMSIRRQAETLDRFQAAGNWNVLVATAVAEEGIDIPSCQFAVSYTMVESGREWTQRQGRARKSDSQFVSIIESGINDMAQLCKAKQQAQNEVAAVMQSCFGV